VTGGGTGIGRATSLLFVQEGARVVVADLNERAGQETVAKIADAGGNAIFVKTDVADEAQVENMVNEAVSRYGTIDILFANAGVLEMAPAVDLCRNDWYKVIDVNLTGVFLCAKHAIPVMQRNGGGSIINTASIAGLVGFGNAPAYTASKGGVILLTKTLALDYAKDNIRVNAVCPGAIRTPMLTEGAVSEMIDDLAKLHPLGRIGEPAEVAAAVLFLASDESSFITGTSLVVDGGYTAQ